MPNWYRIIDDELHGREDDGLHAVLTARCREHPDYEALHEAVQAALHDFLAVLTAEQRRACRSLEEAQGRRRQAEDETTVNVAAELAFVRGLERSPLADSLSPEARAVGHHMIACLGAHHLDDHERQGALGLVLVAELLGATR